MGGPLAEVMAGGFGHADEQLGGWRTGGPADKRVSGVLARVLDGGRAC